MLELKIPEDTNAQSCFVIVSRVFSITDKSLSRPTKPKKTKETSKLPIFLDSLNCAVFFSITTGKPESVAVCGESK